jgi:transglutaminase superfamily protein
MMRAQITLLRAQREMRSLPTGELVREAASPTGASVTDRADDARRIARAVNRAAAYGVFRPKCLVRSRALRQLLDSAGIVGAHVRVGVHLSKGQFQAHAWVEYGGQVVGDDPAFVDRFNPITELQVAALR